MRALLKKEPGCWLSNESCASWKRAQRCCDLNSTLAEQAAKLVRTHLVGLEDAVVYLNEAIGREEREAMTRELTASGLAQEIERTERHMRVVAEDAARVEDERRDVEQRRLTALSEAEAAEAATAGRRRDSNQSFCLAGRGATRS